MEFNAELDWCAVLHCIYPTMTVFNETFQGGPLVAWARDDLTTTTPLTVAILYLVVMIGGDEFLNRNCAEPVRLTRAVVAWNVVLAAFSFFGAAVTLPHLLFGPRGMARVGALASVCSEAAWYEDGQVGHAVSLFVFSKYFELVDTALLVIRRKPLTFLHVAHHALTLLLCHLLYVRRSGTGLAHAAVNLFVHAIMYSYFAMTQIPGLKRLVAKHAYLITILQIAQMVFGAYLNAGVLLVADGPCHVDTACATASLALYALYGVLFTRFYLRRRKVISVAEHKKL